MSHREESGFVHQNIVPWNVTERMNVSYAPQFSLVSFVLFGVFWARRYALMTARWSDRLHSWGYNKTKQIVNTDEWSYKAFKAMSVRNYLQPVASNYFCIVLACIKQLFIITYYLYVSRC